MKVINSENISAFGGLNFVLDRLDQLKIGELLNKELPDLPAQSKYTWRDILYSYWSIFLCGGDCAEDLSDNFRPSLSLNPYIKIPSPDRVLNRLKQITPAAQHFQPKRSKRKHKFVIDKDLNSLLLKVNGILFPKLNNKTVTVDYDNTICYNKKLDATKTYKQEYGYQPGVAFIGSKVVYTENRDGRSTAHVLQSDTLIRMFDLLTENGVLKPNFRADSASYNWETIQVIDHYSNKFYVKARMSSTLDQAIKNITKWEQISESDPTVLRGETIFTPFTAIARRSKTKHKLKSYRLIVTKEKRQDGQMNFFTSEAFQYNSIVTNDHEKTMDEIVQFYNMRGAIEREFEVLKYDFGWKKLPFSSLSYNNTYLILMAICKNIYHYMIQYFSKKTQRLKPTYRLKKFIFRFIIIPSKWIRRSRQNWLKLYGQISFKT